MPYLVRRSWGDDTCRVFDCARSCSRCRCSWPRQLALAADPGAPEFADTLEQRLLACSGCHGKQGEGSRQNEYYPRIAGKPAEYLYRQLVNFRDGTAHLSADGVLRPRISPTSTCGRSRRTTRSSQPPFPTPIQPSATKEALARGEALVRNGDAAKGIPACAACHGKALTGMQPGIPGLVGLYPDYINAQMGAWRSGVRHATEPDCMAKIAAKLSGADSAAVGRVSRVSAGHARDAARAGVTQKLPIACGSQPQ